MVFKKKPGAVGVYNCRSVRERPYRKWTSHEAIDPIEIQELAAIGTPQDEIGDLLGTTAETIRRHFLAEWKYGKAMWMQGHRKKQTDLALKGNVPLLLHFARTVLGQTEQQPTSTTQCQLASWIDDRKSELEKLPKE